MKKMILVALLALAVGTAGCAKKETPPAAPSSSVSEGAVSSQNGEEPPQAEAPGETVPAPADAALYRGEVQSVEERDGAWAVVLKQAAGTDFGASTLTAVLDENTTAGFELSGIQEGEYLEIYYGGHAEEGQEVNAIAANRLPEAGMSVFNGTVDEITPRDDGVDLLLTSLEGNGKILFHIGEETQTYLDLEALQPGDKLNVYFSGITTRSEPPQATALEVSDYAEAVS